MDIDPEKREGLLEAAALQGNEIINGLELRPVTSATWSLLARLKNSFVTGEQDGDYAFAVYSFVYLHAMPISDIRRRVATIDDLRADIYEFMDGRTPGDLFAFTPWITGQMEQVAATITQAVGPAEPSDSSAPKA
jgi:hypothetical protein